MPGFRTGDAALLKVRDAHCCGWRGHTSRCGASSCERNRHFGRPVSHRAVGSTLLLKGLEADIAVILHPELMERSNLYVALTRGACRLIVCSATAVLGRMA